LFASDFKTFRETLKELLQKIVEHGFIIGGKKTSLLFPEMKWLGRVITPKGQRADPGNVKAILDMKPPTSLKSLQSLIGLINWVRMFASVKYGDPVGSESFSTIVKPITALLKVNRAKGPFQWSGAAEKAFNKVKQKLSFDEMIYFPDFTKEFVLVTDASSAAAGWALLQVVDGKS
jgi:hypothetical protein